MKALLILVLSMVGVVSSGLAATVGELRCEYRIDPVGIDTARPHLGWTMESDRRGARQTAYRILVASTCAKLEEGAGDLWDSGKVASSETVGIAYQGRPLRSSERAFWKVQLWDEAGESSGWSGVGTWTMGVLAPEDWHARWISAAGAERYAPFFPDAARHDFRKRAEFAQKHPDAIPRGGPNFSSLLLRREFRVRPGLTRAIVHVSGLGQYELTINGGHPTDALLAPGWTDYRRTVLYDTFDITRLLRPGANAVGLLLGNGMYNLQPDYVRYVKFLNSFGPLKAIAQLRLEYEDGAVDLVGTDGSWQAAPGPLTFDHLYAGEDFDARLLHAGWDEPGFQPRSAWAPALETEGPGGALRGLSAAAPPIRIAQTLTPLSRKQIGPATWVYDLGQNAAIVPRLRARGPRGSSVRVIPAELLGADGQVDRTSATQDGVRPAWWQDTLGGGGTEQWLPAFFYQGGRYLQVELRPAEGGAALPIVEELTGMVLHTSAEPIGEFSCSNELFNRIYTLIRWAQRSNLMSTITDCPHREKMGWLEQYHLNGPSLRYNWDLLTLYRKAMNDMADSQLPNGFVPNIVPEFFVAGGDELTNGFRNSPEWGSSIVMVPWQQYLFSGDVSLIADYYDRMKRYVAFLDSVAQGNVLRVGLGDWYDLGPKPPWGSQLTPVALTATAFFYEDHVILGEMAALLGRADEARSFRQRAAAIRADFNREFFDSARGVYATGSQTAQALPLAFSLAEPSDRKRVAAALVADIRAHGNSFTSGDVGYRFLLQALAMEGRSDVIYALNNQSEKPGYGYQLKRGATSLTEKWDASVGSFGSQNHFMLGQINEWFFHDLAGIQPDETAPGFRSIVIHPSYLPDIRWVKGRYRTVRGTVTSEWRREDGALTLAITIPVNCTATVYVPGPASAVTEQGRPAAASPHVRFLTESAEGALFRVDSGQYTFQTPSH